MAANINKKVFAVLKEIVYFGEKPYAATNYNDLTTSFIESYEKLHKEFPNDSFGWEAKIEISEGIKRTYKYMLEQHKAN